MLDRLAVANADVMDVLVIVAVDGESTTVVSLVASFLDASVIVVILVT